MSKRIKFFITVLWILLSRSYDVYATYQYTPDLSHEANPLASVLGLGWLPILIIVTVLMSYIIYAYYVSVFKKYPLHPKEVDYDFKNFAIFLYLGKKAHWSATLYQLPKDLNRLNHFMGNVLSRSFVFAGIVSTIMWLLINYTDFYKPYHNAPFIYSLLAIGSIGLSIQWMYNEYKKYRLQPVHISN